MENKLYKASKPRYSEFHGFEGCDILERKKLFGFIPYWSIGSFIKNIGQVEETIFLLNNPEEMERRIKEEYQKLLDNGTLKLNRK